MSLFGKTEDFKDRDSSIIANSNTTVRRRAGLPQEIFAAYWRDVHGPLCARLPGLGWYVQHHFNREQDGHLWVFGEGVKPIPDYTLDGMVEIGFGSVSDQKTFKQASPLLFADEQNVFDETVAYDLPHGSTTLLDRLPDPTPNGPDVLDRLHLHFHAITGKEKAFTSYLTDGLAALLAKEDAVMKVRLHLPEPHNNATPNPPAPDVQHAVEPQRLTLGILEVAFHNPLERRRFFTSSVFRELLKEQSSITAQASAFAVSGVYTYIRDGKLTTAGLRGSRAAELITRLGAVNQVAPEVERTMHTGKP